MEARRIRPTAKLCLIFLSVATYCIRRGREVVVLLSVEKCERFNKELQSRRELNKEKTIGWKRRFDEIIAGERSRNDVGGWRSLAGFAAAPSTGFSRGGLVCRRWGSW